VLVETEGKRKMDVKREGPFVITQVYTNNTVRIRRNAFVTERINIRKLTPYRRV